MLVATALLIIGLALLVYGADRLVFSAAVLCRSFGLPPLLIGIMVIGPGISLPELVVSTSSAIHGQMDIAVGTAIGSNITNILLILGGAALLHPLKVNSNLLRREFPLMLLVMLLCGLLLCDNQLSRTDGVIMLIIAFCWLFCAIKFARQAERENNDSFTREQLNELPRADISNTVAFLWLAVALILLPVASRLVIDNATVIAAYFGISELVIALTILSVGTSLPELATMIAGALKGEDDIAIGNLIGSNIYNMVVVLGLPALIRPGSFHQAVFARDYWVMLGVSALFALICLQRRQPGRITGAVLLCGFILWVVILYGFPSLAFW